MSSVQPTHDDAIAFLTAQHEEIRGLFRQVTTSTGDAQRDAFGCLVRLLAVHETAEEEYVHPEVRKMQGGEQIVQARLAEESEAKEKLAELEKLGVDDPSFDSKLAVFESAVDAHARSEEQQEFALLAKSSTETLTHLGEMVEIAESLAPTHPHPHGPDSALGNLLTGPFVAMVDRVRDAVRERRAS